MLTENQKALVLLKEKQYYSDKEGNVYNKKGIKVGKGKNNGGYHRIYITHNSKPTLISLHRFIAYEKYGNELFNHDCVRHLDGDRTNNSWNNIILGSQSDNMMDIPQEIRKRNASLANKIHNHDEIINAHKQGMSYSEIMKHFNISSKGTVSFIVKESMTSEIK